ncbi:hypothetical protein E2I00_004917, partial [Balaenoptera physalus]
ASSQINLLVMFVSLLICHICKSVRMYNVDKELRVFYENRILTEILILHMFKLCCYSTQEVLLDGVMMKYNHRMGYHSQGPLFASISMSEQIRGFPGAKASAALGSLRAHAASTEAENTRPHKLLQKDGFPHDKLQAPMGEAAMNGVTKATLTANSLTYAAESGDSKDITSHMISEYEGSHDYHRNSYVPGIGTIFSLLVLVRGSDYVKMSQNQANSEEDCSESVVIVHGKFIIETNYRDVEKNFYNISNRCSYADHSNKEDIEDVSGILQCTANVLGIFISDSSGMICTIMMWLLIIYLDFMVMLVLLLPSRDFWYSVVNRVVFICLVMLALSSYLRTMLTSPGALQTEEFAEEVIYEYPKCCCIKPEHTHNCSVCKRCIWKMDLLAMAEQLCWRKESDFFVLFTMAAVHPLHPRQWTECSDCSSLVTVILLIFLCLEGLLFFSFTAVMFGTQIHSICNDETEVERLKSKKPEWKQRLQWEEMNVLKKCFEKSVDLKSGLKFEEIQERFGEEFFNICFDENERVLRAVGGTLQDFFNGFDALLEHIRTSFGKQATLESPSFLCKELPEGNLMLHYFHPHHIVGFAMLGMIKAAGKKIYQLDVEVDQVANEKLCSDGSNPGNCSGLTFLIKQCENTNIMKNLPQGTSQVPADLRISINTFCRAFPFHLMFDPHMTVLQLGEGLRKQLRCDTHKVLRFEDCFEIVSPKVNATFERVLLRLSTPFVIRTKPEASGTENKDKIH